MPPSQMSEVKTFIFFDLEATGLPSIYPSNRVRITELAMVAVDVTLFKPPFRVVSQLVIAVNPQAMVSHTAEEITGLSNMDLDHQPSFHQVIPVLMSYLDAFPEPICLIAHNGDRFDFPLLRAELIRCGGEDLILKRRLLSCDTLTMFRALLQTTSLDYYHRLSEQERNEILDCERAILSQPGDNEEKAEDNIEAGVEEEREQQMMRMPDSDPDETNFSDLERTPDRPIPKAKTAPKAPNKGRSFTNNGNSNNGGNNKNGKPTVRRRLFIHEPDVAQQEPEMSQSKPDVPKGYSLNSLHQRLVGSTIENAHHSLGDCCAMMRICHKIQPDFVEYVNANAKLLSTIEPMRGVF